MLLCNCLCIFSVVPHFSLSIFPTIVQGSQKRTLDALELEFQEVVSCLIWCWSSDSCPWEKQHTLLTAKPSLQPQVLKWLSLVHFPVFFSKLVQFLHNIVAFSVMLRPLASNRHFTVLTLFSNIILKLCDHSTPHLLESRISRRHTITCDISDKNMTNRFHSSLQHE